MNTKLIIVGAVIIVLGGISWFAVSKQNAPETAMVKNEETGGVAKESGDAMAGDGDVMQKDEGAMMTAGSYEAYAPEKLAKASEGPVVLFFRASWCPTCRALDADIQAHRTSIPKGTTILDVNYDTEKALKQKYGVTYQHTLVQVDATGMMITKWSASPNLASLLSSIQH